MFSRCKLYLESMRFHKPIGIALLLWPTLWGVWAAAHGQPSRKIVLIFALGTILMRAGGCVINDIADRKWDGRVQRTRNRPLVSGRISVHEAYALCAACFFLAFCLVLLLNTLTIFLSFIGAGLALVYPFTKRWMQAPQLVLGLAFAWGIPMAYAAIQQRVPAPCWYLFIVTTLLAIAYDTLYAQADKEDDVKIGIRSTAILFGRYDKEIVLLLQLSVWLGLIFFGIWQHYSYRYTACAVFSVVFFLYQQKILRQQASAHTYFQAFLNHHFFMLLIFIGYLVGAQ